MKYIYLTILNFSLILSTLASYSQPVLTNQNLANDGDSYTIYTITNLPTNSDPGQSGTNVNWNFSGLGSGTNSTLSYTAASNQNYPNANINMETQGSSNYFDVANSAYTYYGFSTTQASSNFTNGQDQARVPMNYNDTYTDAFAGTYDAFGQVFDRSGNLDVTYDGYGTLQTPQGTYNDVIRLSIVRTSTDETNGQTTSNMLDSIYFWYNETTGHPLMTYTINYVDGSEQGRFANYMDNADVVLSNKEESIEVNAYPNPANNKLSLSSEKVVSEFNLYAATGKKVIWKKPNSTSFKVDVSSLPKGTYFYELRNQSGIIMSRKKLIIQ